MQGEAEAVESIQPTRLMKRLLELCAEPFASVDGDWTIEVDVVRSGEQVMYRDARVRSRRIGPERLARIEDAYERADPELEQDLGGEP